ncbi:MAG TPA: alpha-L-fucosidase [Opitutaceae bacterium]|nr:alpha-L-fucosidase [Opitutaceae bacterium]HND62059.1 alpha-L-fucosidase [Opitutaceae bacterium]
MPPSPRPRATAVRPQRAVPGVRWPDEAWRRSTVDMHIPDWDPAFMAQFDVEEFADALVQSRAQAVLCAAQSHTGLFYYPTKVGVPHRQFAGRDLVAELIAACHRRGIAFELYMSLIFDRWAYDAHPEWRGQDALGCSGFEFGPQPRYGVLCPNTGYRDYVKAWTREVCARYEFEGIFFDMTYWPGVCYCEHCQRRWAREEGGELPRTVNWMDPRWVAFQRRRERWLGEFAAMATRTARHYRPRATISHQSSTLPSNWVKGASHPLVPTCDFLSGDFYGGPLQGSFARKLLGGLTRQRPFVFATSYSSSLRDHTGRKADALLESKVSAAIADHSAFLFIDAIDPAGTVNVSAHAAIGRVHDRVARHWAELGGERVADVALYYSLDSKFDPRDNGRPVQEVFDADSHTAAAMNVASTLITAHVPFAIVTAQHLAELDRHRVLIVPQAHHLSPREAAAMRAFVRRGGALYASGGTSLVDTTGRRRDDFQLADVLGVSLVRADWNPRPHYLAPTVAGAEVFGDWTKERPPFAPTLGFEVRARRGAEVLATTTRIWPAAEVTQYSSIHSNPPWESTDLPELVSHRFGRGRAIYAATPIEDVPGLRDVFVRLVRSLAPAMSFEADAPTAVEVTLFAQPARRRHVLALVNFQAEQPNLPVDGIEVRLRLPKRIRRARLLPAGRSLPVRREGNAIVLRLPRLHTLAMVALDHA